MVQENVVSLNLRIDKISKYKKIDLNNYRLERNQMAEFFILPTYSYFGDFNMLLNVKSQI